MQTGDTTRLNIYILIYLQVEECPHDSAAFIIIGDFLYGDTKDDVSIFVHFLTSNLYYHVTGRGHRDCLHMVVGFTTTYAISAYNH